MFLEEIAQTPTHFPLPGYYQFTSVRFWDKKEGLLVGFRSQKYHAGSFCDTEWSKSCIPLLRGVTTHDELSLTTLSPISCN